MSLIKLNFFNSIKFKLALVFTGILFVFTGSIVLLFNIAINNYLSTRSPVPPAETLNNMKPPAPPEINNTSKDLRSVYSDNLESIQQKSIIGLFPLGILCFIFGYFLAGRFLKPLRFLNEQIDNLKQGKLGIQIEKYPDDEIGKTIKSFNEMSIQLKDSFEKQTQFVQDASHELRTPLTIARTNLETVLDDNMATKEDLILSINNTLLEFDSVNELANDLLTLSRPQTKIKNKEDIGRLLSDLLFNMEDYFKQQKTVLTHTFPDKKVESFINKLEINRAIKNLIDNAVKYSKKSKNPEVSIHLYTENNMAIIEVQDNGCGIPSGELEKIFDRFYRVDKSRERGTGGFGLGLAIVKKIIDDHSGKILVTSEPGKTIFAVILPLA